MKLKEHTRNQKRMYRIHKQKEKIQNLELLVGKLQQENEHLKMINKEYERLDNGKPRGFVITRVDEYDIYDLLRYKENWNKLKKFLEEWKENEEYCYLASSPIDRCRKDIYGEVLDKMQEIERESDKNE